MRIQLIVDSRNQWLHSNSLWVGVMGYTKYMLYMENYYFIILQIMSRMKRVPTSS